MDGYTAYTGQFYNAFQFFPWSSMYHIHCSPNLHN